MRAGQDARLPLRLAAGGNRKNSCIRHPCRVRLTRLALSFRAMVTRQRACGERLGRAGRIAAAPLDLVRMRPVNSRLQTAANFGFASDDYERTDRSLQTQPLKCNKRLRGSSLEPTQLAHQVKSLHCTKP